MFFDKLGSDDWRIRRRIVILLIIWSVALVTYIAIFGQPDSLREAIATALILLIGSLVGSYVFGVIWDGKNQQPGTRLEVKSTTVSPAEAAYPDATFSADAAIAPQPPAGEAKG